VVALGRKKNFEPHFCHFLQQALFLLFYKGYVSFVSHNNYISTLFSPSQGKETKMQKNEKRYKVKILEARQNEANNPRHWHCSIKMRVQS